VPQTTLRDDLCFSAFPPEPARGATHRPHKDGWGVAFFNEGKGVPGNSRMLDASAKSPALPMWYINLIPFKSEVALCAIFAKRMWGEFLGPTPPVSAELHGPLLGVRSQWPACRNFCAKKPAFMRPLAVLTVKPLFCDLLNPFCGDNKYPPQS